MKISARYYGYALVSIVLALFLGWAVSFTWREFRQLHRSFDSVQEDAFQLSDHVDESVNDLNNILLRFNLRGRAEDQTAFQQKNRDLELWFHTRRPNASTAQQQNLVVRIEADFEVYASLAAALMEERARAGTEPLSASALGQAEAKAASILQLSEKLRVVEHDAEAQFMEDSRHALVWLQELLAVNIGLLVITVGTGAVAVYRGVIGPLRTELSQSRAHAVRQEKLASLGTLAAGVAHEIRNPLTAINVRVHSLKKNLVPNSSEQEDALVIDHEIQRLESIVQEFLLFARPADPKLLTVSADSLFARMQSLFGPQFEKTSVRLNLESMPDTWVQVDPRQIEQVLINLIQNAAESMERGGSITLRAGSNASRLNGSVRPVVTLEVADTGKGIPPEVRKRIFDPFFTTKEEGTGLGLAIAARIVEKHGGTLECRSEMNRGTTFSVLLPQAKPETSHEQSN